MLPPPLDPALWARGIQAAAALVLFGYAAAALAALAPVGDVRRARAVLTEGVHVALALMVPATVLRTLALRSWEHILALAMVLGLRIVLKKLFLREKSRLVPGPRKERHIPVTTVLFDVSGNCPRP